MTNHWIDIKNSDCILIMGSNAAENHPVSFKYVTEAMEKGPRSSAWTPGLPGPRPRPTSTRPLRSGTDIAFLGGMIKYILDNKLYSQEYVSLYTNAPFLGKEYGFKTACLPATRRKRAPPG
jgi:formate dehydrogenase major subunit